MDETVSGFSVFMEHHFKMAARGWPDLEVYTANTHALSSTSHDAVEAAHFAQIGDLVKTFIAWN
jgi:predicted NAD-dependent protein-ADP-ribosyltransferase YbiA (DUF1768 family)